MARPSTMQTPRRRRIGRPADSPIPLNAEVCASEAVEEVTAVAGVGDQSSLPGGEWVLFGSPALRMRATGTRGRCKVWAGR